MCVKLKDRDGIEKKYDPSESMIDQLESAETVVAEGHLTKQEKKFVLSFINKKIGKAAKKIDKKIQEIEEACKK